MLLLFFIMLSVGWHNEVEVITVTSQREGSGLLTFWLTEAFLCGVSSQHSGFLPQSKEMQIRSIVFSKLAIVMNLSENGCSSLC